MEAATTTPSSAESSPPQRDFIKHAGKTDQVLSVAHGVLDMLQLVAVFTPVSAIKPAAGIALKLVELAQKSKSNSAGCNSLIEDACHVVFVIHSECRSIQGESEPYREIPAGTMRHVESLKLTMEKIHEACVDITSRAWVRRLMTAGHDKERINDLRSKLELALDMFGATSLITISELVQRYCSQAPASITSVTNVQNNVQTNVQIEQATLNSFTNCGNVNHNYYPTETYDTPGSPTNSALAHVGMRAADAFLSRTGRHGTTPVSNRVTSG